LNFEIKNSAFDIEVSILQWKSTQKWVLQYWRYYFEGFTSLSKHSNIEETLDIDGFSSISDCYDIEDSSILAFNIEGGALILILAGTARAGQLTVIAGCSTLLCYLHLLQ
jgi:hypothetical protein